MCLCTRAWSVSRKSRALSGGGGGGCGGLPSALWLLLLLMVVAAIPPAEVGAVEAGGAVREDEAVEEVRAVREVVVVREVVAVQEVGAGGVLLPAAGGAGARARTPNTWQMEPSAGDAVRWGRVSRRACSSTSWTVVYWRE